MSQLSDGCRSDNFFIIEVSLFVNNYLAEVDGTKMNQTSAMRDLAITTRARNGNISKDTSWILNPVA